MDQSLKGGEDIGPRLDRLPTTRSVWGIVVILSLAFFFEVFDLLLTGYIAPGLTKSGILTVTTKGLFGTTGVASFIAALFAGLSLGTLITGFLADRFGRKTVFLGALLWFTVCAAVMAFQETAADLNLWRFLTGLGLGVEIVTINTCISEFVPKQVRGRAFALSQTVGFSAVPCVAVLAWLLIPHDPYGLEGWRWVVLLGAAGALVPVFIGLRLPESPRWLAAKGRVSEADAILRTLEARAAAESGAVLPEPGPPEPVEKSGSFAEIWRAPYAKRAVMLVIFNIFQTVGFYGFVNWVPSLLVEQGISLTKTLTYTMLIAFAAPVGPMLGTLVADRVERKHLIMGTAAIVAVCGMVFGHAREPAVLIVMGLVITICQNMLSFSYHAYQTELFATPIRAKAVGFVYAWSRISAMFNAFIIAFILKESGSVGVFAFIALAMGVVVVVIGAMGPLTKGRSLEEISNDRPSRADRASTARSGRPGVPTNAA